MNCFPSSNAEPLAVLGRKDATAFSRHLRVSQNGKPCFGEVFQKHSRKPVALGALPFVTRRRRRRTTRLGGRLRAQSALFLLQGQFLLYDVNSFDPQPTQCLAGEVLSIEHRGTLGCSKHLRVSQNGKPWGGLLQKQLLGVLLPLVLSYCKANFLYMI